MSKSPASALVIDDDDAVRMAMADALEASGIAVLSAGDGEEALRLLD